MNKSETTSLLGLIAGFDGRELNQGTVDGWAEILRDVSFAVAKAEVLKHYANTRERIMPVYIMEAHYEDLRRQIAIKGPMHGTCDKCGERNVADLWNHVCPAA